MEFMKTYQILAKKAKNDFLTAKVLYNSKESIEIEIVLFHLQQAVEKILKALLIYNKIKAPRTHKLEILINLTKKSNLEIYKLK